MDNQRVSRSRCLNVKWPSLRIASQDARYALFVRAPGIHSCGVNRVAWSGSQNGLVLSGKPPVKGGRREFVALRRSGPPCWIQLCRKRVRLRMRRVVAAFENNRARYRIAL